MDDYSGLKNGGFQIIGHLDQIDDFSSELQLLSNMKHIETDIIARMLHDYIKCEPLTLKAIPGFNINSVNYEMLGPVSIMIMGLCTLLN